MPLVKMERRRQKVSEEPAEEMEEDDTSADNNVGLNSLRREPLVFCVYQFVLSAVSYHPVSSFSIVLLHLRQI